MNNRLLNASLLIVFTVASGYGDAQGFLHAAKVWTGNQLNWPEVGKSALGYFAGIILYWLSIRFFNALGLNSPEIQTIGWFVVTIAGVAFFSGEFLKWGRLDQALGVIAVVVVGVLMFRRGG